MKVKSVFFTWEGQCDYLTPSVTVLDCQSEGLLCISGGGTIESGTEDNWGEL